MYQFSEREVSDRVVINKQTRTEASVGYLEDATQQIGVENNRHDEDDSQH